MAKKSYQILLEPETHTALKLVSAVLQRPIGDVIKDALTASHEGLLRYIAEEATGDHDAVDMLERVIAGLLEKQAKNPIKC